MREIVHVQLGRCGNYVGTKFWEEISNEHGLDRSGRFCGEPSQQRYIDTYFVEEKSPDRKYKARAILADLDSCGTINEMLSTRFSSLFKPENIVRGGVESNDNWAIAYYSEGLRLLDPILDRVRTEAEACDLIQGIQIVHSLGGGTGSGMGSLLAQSLIEEYPDKILKSYAIMPTVPQETEEPKPSIPPTEQEPAREHNPRRRGWQPRWQQPPRPQRQPKYLTTYNAVLTIPYLINYAHDVFCMDNIALTRVCNNWGLDPSHDNMNDFISLCMSGITACLRFPDRLCTDFKKIFVNTAPFPRLHFFIPGYMSTRHKSSKRKNPIQNLIEQMFKAENLYYDCNPEMGRYFTAAAIFRSKISPKKSIADEVEEKLLGIQNKYSEYFVKWIPQNIKTVICNVPPQNTHMSVASLSNTSAIQEPFQKLADHFRELFETKKYLHMYIREGMEFSEFSEAHDKLLSLISEYREYEAAPAETDFVEEFISTRR